MIFPVAASVPVTVMEYEPGVVPVLPPPPVPPPPPPPHPSAPIDKAKTMALAMRCQARRFEVMPKKSPAARRATNPPERNSRGPGARAPLVGAVVETVRVLVTAAVPAMFGAVGEREQVGMSRAWVMLVVTEQVRFTVPVKPSEGVRSIVDVLPLVAPAFT